MRWPTGPSIIAAIVAVAAALPSSGLGAVQYTITDVGTLGGSFSEAYGINNNGQVVGDAAVAGSGDSHAFIYSSGTMRDLGTLGTGIGSTARAINDVGDVVGYSLTGAQDRYGLTYITHAFLYTSGSGMTDLGTLGGISSYAYDINNAGQIVGSAYTASASNHAFLYAAGSMSDLGTLGGSNSDAASINESGQIVGTSTAAMDHLFHAATFDGNTRVSDLAADGWADSWATSNNADGSIVGAYMVGKQYHAFLYADGAAIDLGTLGGRNAAAYAINASGQIVGDSQSPLGTHAFVFKDGTMSDLNSLLPPDSGWILRTASGINDLGQIVGSGTSPTGYTHAYLLTPIPEPLFIAFWTAGAAALANRRRRQSC